MKGYTTWTSLLPQPIIQTHKQIATDQKGHHIWIRMAVKQSQKQLPWNQVRIEVKSMHGYETPETDCIIESVNPYRIKLE